MKKNWAASSVKLRFFFYFFGRFSSVLQLQFFDFEIKKVEMRHFFRFWLRGMQQGVTLPLYRLVPVPLAASHPSKEQFVVL